MAGPRARAGLVEARARCFSADTQRLAAGSQDAQLRAGVQQGVGERGAAFNEVLAIIQNQEQLRGGEIPRDESLSVTAPGFLDDHGLGYGLRNESGIGDRGELDPPDPAPGTPRHQGGHSERESGLAAPTRTREGE